MDKELNNNTPATAGAGSGAQAPRGEKDAAEGHHTEVENAHAAGVGAMGRNDEKLPGGEEGATADAGEPVY